MQDDKKKDSNPKDALGIKKVPLHAVPVKPLFEVGLAMMEGGRKYGTHNYRAIGVRVSTYYDAVMRHMMSWWEGEDIDPDSGVHHLVKAMACLFVVRDGMHMENCIDDRPIRYPSGGMDMTAFNKIASDLITKYPECAKAFTQHSLYPEDQPHPDQRHELGTVRGDGAVYVKQGTKPKFKKGDGVKIMLRADANKTLREFCTTYNNIGVVAYTDYVGQCDLHRITVALADLKDARRTFYLDELTLIKGD